MTAAGEPDRGRLLLVRAGRLWLLGWRTAPGLVTLSLVTTVVGGLAPASLAWFTKLVVDALASGRTGQAVLAPAVALAVVGLLAAVLPHLERYLQGEQNRRVDRALQDRLYTAVNGFDGLSRFENPTFLDRLRMATQATGSALAPATSGVYTAGRDLVAVVSLLATLAVLSPVMAVVVLAAAVPAMLAQVALSRRRISMLAGLSPAMRRTFFYGSLITEVEAAKEIRLYRLGDFLKNRMLGELATVHAGERGLDRRELRTQAALAVLGALVSGGGLVWTVHRAATGALSIGDVTAFVAALAAAQAALAGLVVGLVAAHEAVLLYGYADDVSRTGSDLPATDRPLVAAAAGAIELRDVWFRYDEDHPWVLRGVDLTIHEGQSLALVGLNGSGKSTLVKLLCRFYDPTMGSIRWNGVDLRDLDVAALRQRLGVLFQDFMCYDLSAAENIAVGDLAAMDDRQRIVAAAERAAIGDALAALPHGYDTMLSRTFFLETDKTDPAAGVVLSGGQWQRVALARTLLRRDPELLILDEPSSGLDPEAEHAIHDGLRRHRAGRTSLLISHRLGAVRDADRIVVLADGRVAEDGTHDELLAAGGVYRRLFTMQADGYRADTDAEKATAFG